MLNLELAEKVRTYALTKATDQKFAQNLMAMADILGGVRLKEAWGGGPWHDITERTYKRAQREAFDAKKRELILYTSDTARYRFSDTPKVEMDKLIASVEADLALVQSTY